MAPWLQVLEAYAVAALLRTPGFHRMVEKVARGVHRVQHGTPPEEMGGTKIDEPQRSSGFMGSFVDEVKSQITGAETKQRGGVNMDPRAFENPHSTRPDKEEATDAESIWQQTANQRQGKTAASQQQGFMGEYLDALREQVRSNKRGSQ